MATTVAPPPAAMMPMSSKNLRIRLSVPERNAPLEYSLGPSVRVQDLMNLVQEELGCTPRHQRVYQKGKKIGPDTELGALCGDSGSDVDLELVYGGLNGGADEGCHCCGMHCMAYPECKMRFCCFFNGCDLLFNKLQLFCCSWQYAPCEAPECLCQCVTRICCCVGGCDTKCCQFQAYCCKCACCTDIEMD